MTESTTPPTAERTAPEAVRLLRIGEVAAATDLSLRSLRHWDEVGLLQPSGRSDGNYRLYTSDDVDRILLIRRMKPLGYSLDEMRAALADIDALAGDPTSASAAQARARLAALAEDAGERRAKLARQLAMADEFIDLLTGTLT